jgi:tRNA pseudouridine13 synthase
MFGATMREPAGEAARRETAALARWGVSMEDLERVRKSGAGARRPYRVRLIEPSLEAEPEGVRARFTLPSGAYATVILRELARTGQG